jgi:hypothetical protein
MSAEYVTLSNHIPLVSAARSIVGEEILLDGTHSDLLRSDSIAKVLLEQTKGL